MKTLTYRGYIARDEDKVVWFHEKRPKKCGSGWTSSGKHHLIGKDYFGDVRYDDTEPKKVTITVSYGD